MSKYSSVIIVASTFFPIKINILLLINVLEVFSVVSNFIFTGFFILQLSRILIKIPSVNLLLISIKGFFLISDISLDFPLIFESLLLDTKFILSTIFVLLVFYFTKNKKIFYYVLFLGISYLLSLIIIFLITPNVLTFQLEGGPRIILSLTCLFVFFGLLQIYCMKEKISQ